MKAAVLHGPRDLRIEDVPMPAAGDDGLVLKVHCCAICGTDTQTYLGKYGGKQYPKGLGHEASGEVVEVGVDAGNYAIGDRLTFWVSGGCFAEYTRIVPRDVAVGRLTDDMTWEEGANTQLLCACLRAVDCAQIGEGERVLILGSGPVGLLTLQGVRGHTKAGAVAATDLFENRIALARELGADVALSGADPDWPQQVVDAIGEVDVVFDCMNDDLSPDHDAGEKLLSCTRKGGRIIVVSLSDESRYPSPQVVLKTLISVHPTFVPMERVRELMDISVALVADGRADVCSFITHRIPLERLAEGIEMSRKRLGEVVKIMVNTVP